MGDASKANPLDRYKQAFREEAREILVELESALLELNENSGNKELVGRVFRALHTIKGSGAMFGFDELAAFTHSLETVFDEVRGERLSVSSELIDLTFAALDQIKIMLGESGDGEAVDATATAAILARLRRLAGKPCASPSAPPRPQPPAPIVVPTGAANGWRIHFAPGPDLLRNGTNPLLLLRELRQLGSLKVTASLAAIPPLGELDPERCYLSWDLVLTTAAAREAIRDVFIFVEDCCELTLDTDLPAVPVSDPVTDPAAAAPTPVPEERSKYGRRSYDSPDNASSIRVPAAKLDQVRQLGGRTGHRASPIGGGRHPPRRSGGHGGVRGSRAPDGGASRKLDEHSHVADSRLLSNASAGSSTTWRGICARRSNSPSREPKRNWTRP